MSLRGDTRIRHRKSNLDTERYWVSRNSWATAALLPRWFYYIIYSCLCTQDSFYAEDVESNTVPVWPHCPLWIKKDNTASKLGAPLAQRWAGPWRFLSRGAFCRSIFQKVSPIGLFHPGKKMWHLLSSVKRRLVLIRGNKNDTWKIYIECKIMHRVYVA